jgi:hypothetical protein
MRRIRPHRTLRVMTFDDATTPVPAPEPPGDLRRAVGLAVGAVQVATTMLRAALGRAPGEPGRAFDIAVGAGSLVGSGLAGAARRAADLARPATGVVLHPPVLPPRYHPGRWLDLAAYRGREVRLGGERDVERVVDALIPVVVARALERLDLTQVVAKNVDIDALVAEVDLDRVAARIDVDAIAGRVDIDAIIARIDLVGLTEQVIDAVDLPAIIRESTGSIASETVRDVRMRGIGADETVAKVVDRILRRRRPATEGGAAVTDVVPP